MLRQQDLQGYMLLLLILSEGGKTEYCGSLLFWLSECVLFFFLVVKANAICQQLHHTSSYVMDDKMTDKI